MYVNCYSICMSLYIIMIYTCTTHNSIITSSSSCSSISPTKSPLSLSFPLSTYIPCSLTRNSSIFQLNHLFLVCHITISLLAIVTVAVASTKQSYFRSIFHSLTTTLSHLFSTNMLFIGHPASSRASRLYVSCIHLIYIYIYNSIVLQLYKYPF